MTLKEALEVLRRAAGEFEVGALPRPTTLDELAERLWRGDFKDEFGSEEEFKRYMHELFKSDLSAKDRQSR